MDYLQYKGVKALEGIQAGIKVLNLIINGLPSIPEPLIRPGRLDYMIGFKPYYKWITFNTLHIWISKFVYSFCFKPYYKWITFNTLLSKLYRSYTFSFKPYYKWITFNTFKMRNIKLVAKSFKPYYKWITFNTINKNFNKAHAE